MTRLLCITSLYPPHHEGGYEVSCQDVMVRLAERGHDVTVLCGVRRMPGVDDPPGERTGSLPVRRDLRLYIDDTGLLNPTLRERLQIEKANQMALRDALDAAKPDVVAVWHVGALSLGLVTTLIEQGRPLVYGISDDWLTYVRALDPWLRLFLPWPRIGRLLRPLVKVPTTVPDVGSSGTFCFISEFTRRRSEAASGWRFPDSTVVFSGIDGRLFHPPAGADVLAERAREPFGWRLLYVGRFDPRKGIETVIRAMADLPAEAVLEVQGTGSEAEQHRLEAIAADLGVTTRVTFERLPRSAMPSRYAAADVCVFPSEWEEPFGLVPVESMACGTPVVATCVGGSKEFLRDGVNCVRFQAGNAAELADAVRRVAGDAVLRSTLISNGRITAEFLDVERLTDAYEARHTAAAEGFVNGRPPDRRLPLPPEQAQPTVWSRMLPPLGSENGRLLHVGIGAAPEAVGGTVVHVGRDGRRGASISVAADPVQLPFRSGAFGQALCESGLDRSASPSEVVRELLRVCEPSGTAYLAEPNRHRLTALRSAVTTRGKRPPTGWTATELRRTVRRAGASGRQLAVGWGDATPTRRLLARLAGVPPVCWFNPVILFSLKRRPRQDSNLRRTV